MLNEYDDEYQTCERTYASLRIMNDDLDPEEISRQLGIQPTWAWRKGEPRGARKIPSRIGIWGLSTEVMQSRDIRRHLDWLIDQMIGKEEYLKQLQTQGYRMDVFCYWLSNGQGGPTVSPKNMKGLANLGIELGFDFWMGGDDENDVQSNEK
jgi:hypothetical protein